MNNWRTSTGGLLAAVGIALRHAPPSAAQWADAVEILGLALLGVTTVDARHVKTLAADVESIKSNTTTLNKP